ncbi:MAG TPA: ACP phosphodiesterase [Haliscomenobacter sp.]|uniref:acyl carrier protein phosphodiesterase n=1 Tax=Haliscomenobacter sp. TaxID=2717303 RepID=UPI002CB75C3E|nr:ACP phosphodiesterase [Haliscomenobacter sp.]HOY17972.1 ACP phosphodiesterase [Haliscomenobacter sp.]
MNFLAHFFLSGDDPALMTGNFLADFISNREVNELPEEIRRGIVLHRQIDQYTDAHEAVRQSIQRLYPRHRKYAPVLVDVYYDYFLIHNWAQFTTEDFAAFRERAYAALRLYLPAMPPSLHSRVLGMVQADWLSSYGVYEGLEYTFMRMKSRTSMPEQLEGAVETLKVFREEMDAEFRWFFPEVVGFVGGK